VERLRYPILSRIRTYLYQQLLRIWKRALDFVGGGFSAAGPLLTTNLVRLHKNSGHASYTDMRNCLLRAKLWSEEEHSDALKEIIRECPCEKARKPSTPPKVSLSTVTKGQELCMYVVYLMGTHTYMQRTSTQASLLVSF
jgi:hypothetical protein